MNTAPGFRLGHPLHPMDARFKLQPRKDPLALDPRHGFLDPAEFGCREVHQIEPPALAFGIALIHPQKIAREKRRLLAPRPGADFQDRRPRICRILGQKRDPEPALHLGDARFQRGQLILGQRSHLGVRKHRLGLAQIGQGLPVSADLGHHRLQVGIFPAEGRNLGRRRASRQLRLEKFEAAHDLVEFFEWHHAGVMAADRRRVKRRRGQSRRSHYRRPALTPRRGSPLPLYLNAHWP